MLKVGRVRNGSTRRRRYRSSTTGVLMIFPLVRSRAIRTLRRESLARLFSGTRSFLRVGRYLGLKAFRVNLRGVRCRVRLLRLRFRLLDWFRLLTTACGGCLFGVSIPRASLALGLWGDLTRLNV